MITLTEYYYYKYWVGLLDGCGEIQVNHWRYEFLQYRILIRLKYNKENEEMLNLLKKYVRGYVSRDPKNSNYILWYEIGTKKIQRNLLPLLKRYNPLTDRLYLQYLFLLHCMNHQSIPLYLQERSFKYMIPLINRSSEEINNSFYFSTWISGYLEAIGTFILRENSSKAISLLIKEKNEYNLLFAIKLYFGFPNKVRALRNGFFELEASNKFYLNRIVNQGVEFPFLGFKKLSFEKFEECVMSSYRCVSLK